VTPSFSDGIELWPTRNKFLAREKIRARMHDIRMEFFVRVSCTSFLDGKLGLNGYCERPYDNLRRTTKLVRRLYFLLVSAKAVITAL